MTKDKAKLAAYKLDEAEFDALQAHVNTLTNREEIHALLTEVVNGRYPLTCPLLDTFFEKGTTR